MTTTRYSTDAAAPGERFAFWRDAICAVYVRLDADPVGVSDRAFSGAIDVQCWDGAVRVSHVAADGQHVRRPAGAEDEDCLVSIQLRGTGRVTQAGRTAVLKPGDLALYDSSRPYELAFDSRFDQFVVQMPRHLLVDRGVALGHAVARRASSATLETAVAVAVVRAMFEHAGRTGGSVRDLVVQQAVDHLASALRGRSAEGTRTGAAATLADAMCIVEAHATSSELTVASLASRLGLSARSVQRLFAEGGDSPSSAIARTRLRLAVSALRDPLRAHHTVARVAADNGFYDAAHLAREVRRVHGCSPTELRQGAPAAS